MKRTVITLTLALLFSIIGMAWSQVPAQRVIIMDSTGTHAASVSGGQLGTSASVTVDSIVNLGHINSVTHVTVHSISGVGGLGDSANAALRVNCVTGCSASAGVTGSTHVSVALHVAGTINGARFHIQGLGIPGQAHGGVLTVQGVAGGVAVPVSGSLSVTTDNVNVFHQSTIRHISSTTHVFLVGMSREAHLAVAQSGAWTMSATQASGHHFAVTMPGHVAVSFAGGGHIAITQGAAALQVDCSNCSAASVVNVGHVSAVTHVVGNVVLRNVAGTAVTVTGTALDVNCTGCSAASVTAVSHISSAVHIAGLINGGQLHVQGLGIPGQAHGGVLTVQGVAGGVNLNVNCAAGCSASSSDAVNVFHQSTIRHISSVTHVAISSFSREAHMAVAQSGSFTIQAAHQGGTWTIAHIGGAVHLAGTINGARLHVQGLGIPGQAHGGVLSIQGVNGMVPVNVDQNSKPWTVSHISSITHVGGTGNAGALHISGISNVGSGSPSSGTTPMACHTTVAFSTTADLLLAHSQNAWKIYICSVVLVAAGAESVSIVEGTGATCQTSLRGIIGGFGGTMSLAANGGFSSVSPFPWIASSVAGNAVCLDKSGSGNVSGAITYRAAP
jgi:hypothetical protein